MFNLHNSPAKPQGFFCTGITADFRGCKLVTGHPDECITESDELNRYQYLHAFTGEILFSKASFSIKQWPGHIIEYMGKKYLVLYGMGAGADAPDTFLGSVMAPSRILSLKAQLERAEKSTSKAAKMIISKIRRELSAFRVGLITASDPTDIYDLESI